MPCWSAAAYTTIAVEAWHNSMLHAAEAFTNTNTTSNQPAQLSSTTNRPKHGALPLLLHHPLSCSLGSWCSCTWLAHALHHLLHRLHTQPTGAQIPACQLCPCATATLRPHRLGSCSASTSTLTAYFCLSTCSDYVCRPSCCQQLAPALQEHCCPRARTYSSSIVVLRFCCAGVLP
jgi:hypothetical protein